MLLRTPVCLQLRARKYHIAAYAPTGTKRCSDAKVPRRVKRKGVLEIGLPPRLVAGAVWVGVCADARVRERPRLLCRSKEVGTRKISASAIRKMPGAAATLPMVVTGGDLHSATGKVCASRICSRPIAPELRFPSHGKKGPKLVVPDR
eukprot:scaffold37235_cov63-Phaeocystis_antarctica.AAC.5